MNAEMNAKALIICLLLAPAPGMAQGFAGLGADAEGFAVPMPNPDFAFPEDHGPHPAYRIEWWYLTATLSGADGQDYGAQWTLFRSALGPETGRGWSAPQIWMGHAAVTTPDMHYTAERLGRGGIGQAGAAPEPFTAWIDDWAMTSTAPNGADALSALTVTARGSDFSYDFDLQAHAPLIFHGDGGYSVKSAEGQASYYYSQPFYYLSGTLMLPEGPMPVTGTAWLDREWSSQPLSQTQEGWDWFSLQFTDGARLMGFGLRATDDTVYTSATWIAADGTTTAYPDGALSLTPLITEQVAGATLPVEWRVELPARDLDITTTPLNPQSWMPMSFPYWEGPIRFAGTHTGRGYLEMTGYD